MSAAPDHSYFLRSEFTELTLGLDNGLVCASASVLPAGRVS
jgi:hypothetical protein